MRAMILAAGLGTRLGALGAALPKILIDVAGTTLLARHVSYLEELGAERIVINVHHHADMIEQEVSQLQASAEIICLREPALLGTAGGVRNALPLLGAETFLVLYGDVLFPDRLDPMIGRHAEQSAAATLAVHEAGSVLGKGVVEVDEDGRIVRFVEKQGDIEAPALINSGFYALEPAVVDRLVPGAFSDFGRDVFPALLADGAPLHAYRLPRPVIDVGTPEGLAEARRLADQAGAAPKELM